MKRAAAIVAVALTVAACAAAAPEEFRDSPALTAVAKRIGHAEARVYCAVGVPEWKTALEQYGRTVRVQGYTLLSTREMFLSPWACGTLEGWKRGRYVQPHDLGGALLTLTHEAAHLRGIRDERQAECSGLRQVVPVARRFFGVKRKASQQAVYDGALRSHARTAYAC